MNTKKNMQNGPLAVRLMMATIFLPVTVPLIVVTCWVFVTERADEEFIRHTIDFTIFGMPSVLFAVLMLLVIPAVSLLLILWKGCWRFVLLLLTLDLLFGFALMTGEFFRAKPDDRVINVSRAVPEGANVYCNGVLLGQVPFSIRVSDLKAKVPQWTTPPDQTWFINRVNPVYTWFPWDCFERDRYEQGRFLDAQKSTLAFDTASKYWWKIERNGTTWCFCDQYRNNRYSMDEANSFDRVLEYPLRGNNTLHAPTKQAVLDVLTLSYDQLSEKEKDIWAEYLATLPTEWYWGLSFRDDSKEKYKEMMERVARRKYGISRNPGEEECRRLLARIMEENEKNYGISYGGYIIGLGEASATYSAQGIVAFHALTQMGENATEPIRRMLLDNRHWWVHEGQTAPLISAAVHIKSPELFEDLVRFYALNDMTLDAVLTNPDERAVPLFRTLMSNRPLYYRLYRDAEISGKIEALTHIIDDRLEPYIRDEIARIVDGRDGYAFGDVLAQFISSRSRLNPEQRRELRQWVESLRIGAAIKSEILSQGHFSVMTNTMISPYGRTFTMSQTPDGKNVRVIMILGDEEEPKIITTRTLIDWLGEHPDGTIADYFRELAPEILKGADMDGFALKELLLDESPEAGEILLQYWNDPDKKDALLGAMRACFSQPQLFTNQQMAGADYESVRLPGTYYDLVENNYLRFVVPKVNPVVIAMFKEIRDETLCLDFLNATFRQDTPGKAELLELWSDSENKRLKQLALETLEMAKNHEAIRERSKELLLQLAAGKITPDDLLPKPVPWVWESGKYVQKTTAKME